MLETALFETISFLYFFGTRNGYILTIWCSFYFKQKDHGKIYWAKAFVDELLQQSKDVLDADAIQEIIKTCNVMKNEKVQAEKRKVKGQAQKAQAKRDKQKELEAQKKQAELFGDSNQYDEYDVMGEDYEDAFF
mgnify:CR=1 FL=1